MKELTVDWGRVFSVWWLMTWRMVLGLMLLSMIVTGAEILIGEAAETQDKLTIVLIFGFLFWVLAIAWHIAVIRMALRKKYKHFRIALLAQNSN